MNDLEVITQRVIGSLLVWALLWSVSPVQQGVAQDGSGLLRSQSQPLRVSVTPVYQQFTDEGQTVSELSSQIGMVIPLGQRFQVRARGQYASIEGKNFTRVNGLNDFRGTVTYAQPIGEASLVFNLNANLPVGKRELSTEELQTTTFTSNNFYDFKVSSFGRGLGLAPSVTAAVPITERLVVGIGGAYQYQRGYRPAQGMEELYIPGDAMEVKGGLDYQVSRSSLLGVDVAFQYHQTDRVGDLDRFESGNKLVGRARYLVRDGFTSFRIMARYANWEESRFLPLLRTNDGFTTGTPVRRRVIPSHGMGLVSYRTRFDSGLRLSARLSGHWYSETDVYDAKTVGSLRVSPSVKLAQTLVLAPHAKYTAGSFTGLEGGLRLEVQY